MELSKKMYALFVCLCMLHSLQAQKIIDYVDPFIGSGGHGHVFVGANVPYGAVQVGPSNFYKGWDWCSGYNYRDSVIVGFSQLHLSGTGIGDLGDVLVMPYMGDVKLNKGKEKERYSGYASKFSRKTEKVTPGYYSVNLDDYNIDVELSASERVGYHKYTFPQGKDARIIIDLNEGINDRAVDTYMELVDKYTIKGYRSSEGWGKKQQVFFAIKLSVPIHDFSIYEDVKFIPGKKGRGKSIKSLISFAKSPGTVSLKVGISPVSSESALMNIKAEIPHWDFEETVKQAEQKWNKELSKIIVETLNESDKRIFYTAMFHLMTHPSLFNDQNGDYMGSDWKVHKNPGFDNYTIFSLWDTYRAAHPLYTIIDPKRTADFVNSMLAIYDQTGQLPIWHLRGYDTGTMVGINSLQIIAEAYMKGNKGFDPERAFQALKAVAMSDVRGMDFDRDFKAIPSDVMKNRPVATALEYAIGTASIALMVQAMNKVEDYKYFSKRARNYKLYYDKEVGFFRGRMSDGSWNPVFHPIKSKKPWATDYAEGNPWQYLWLVPQDVEGLIELLGGEKAFADKLNTFFSLDSGNDEDILFDLTGCIGQYAHGNEPSHHIAYLYAYIGQQWKTARLTRYILKNFYHDQPDGIIGNEDCGQMSAWYIMSSLGFYPVFTASGQYVLGSPLFDKVTINHENGKKFIIEAVDNSPENIYIQDVELNGKKYDLTYITHQDIMQGGKLIIRMGSEPNYDFGSKQMSRPQNRTISIYASKPFVHPGMAQSYEDLEFMRTNVLQGNEPWKTAFNDLKKQTSLNFVPCPIAFVSEDAYGVNSFGGKEFCQSAMAAYKHSLVWYITKDQVYADKAIEILNAWAYKLHSFDANNAKLNVGLWGYYFLNAAEILKYSDAGWSERDMAQFEKMVLTILYPTIKDFFTEANGNWDASMISTMLCIAVYTDNREIFNKAIDRYLWGPGNSGITKYIYPGGQSQEAIRDWDHAQLGIGEFDKAAQTARNQGVDLYSVAQDRLAYAYELTAKVMLGNDIDIYGTLSTSRMDTIKDIYQSIYDYYINVKGTELPYTKQFIQKHVHPAFSIGTLTGLKYHLVKSRQMMKTLPVPDFLKPTEIGALNAPTRDIPSGSIRVNPGESVQDVIDRHKGSGKCIVLEKGVHILKAPLKIYSGITLCGYGKQSVLYLSPEMRTATIINAEDNISNFTLRDVLIEGAINVKENSDPNHDRRLRLYMLAPSREGIMIRSENGGRIENLTFENVTLQNFTKNDMLIIGGSGIKINRCNFTDNGAAVVPGSGFHHNLNLSYVTNGSVTNSRFCSSPWGNGISISFCKKINVSNNEMCRNKLSGIYCVDSENISINNNLTEGNDEDGINIDALYRGCNTVEIQSNLSQNNSRKGIRINCVTALRQKDNKLLINRSECIN